MNAEENSPRFNSWIDPGGNRDVVAYAIVLTPIFEIAVEERDFSSRKRAYPGRCQRRANRQQEKHRNERYKFSFHHYFLTRGQLRPLILSSSRCSISTGSIFSGRSNLKIRE